MNPINIPRSIDSRRIPINGTILVAHQPECMPWLGNISKATMGDVYLILDSVQYVKEHWQNRNKIRLKCDIGYQWLIIPVLYAKNHLIKTNEVRLTQGIWKRKHLKAFELSYSKAPFFEEIYNDIQLIYSNKFDYLIDFLMEFIKYAFCKFEINIPVYRTSELIKLGYKIEGKKSELIISMCKAINADTFIFGKDGRKYIEKEIFNANKINFFFQDFTHPVYNQIHGDFISHLSFLDLLFNYGPKSIDILGKSNYQEE
jgi:hypothetical protein